MTPQERIDHYNRSLPFPESLFVGGDGQIVGAWILGNNYQATSAIYGSYPRTYLRRVRALFPDKVRALHLFAGRVDLRAWPGDTADINPEVRPTYVCDAGQDLGTVPLETYDVVLADPPYSVDDAERYGTTMVRRNKVLEHLAAGCRPGTHVAWLDQVLPMHRRSDWHIAALIGIVRSTNHRFRILTIFERKTRRTTNDEGRQ